MKILEALAGLLAVRGELVEVDDLFFVGLEDGEDVAWTGAVEVLHLEQVEYGLDEEGTEVHALEGDEVVLELVVLEGDVLVIIEVLAVCEERCVHDGQPDGEGLSDYGIRLAELGLDLQLRQFLRGCIKPKLPRYVFSEL